MTTQTLTLDSADALVAYEQIRWPEGKVPGGKG
jgi:hypothetical protein